MHVDKKAKYTKNKVIDKYVGFISKLNLHSIFLFFYHKVSKKTDKLKNNEINI